MKKSNLIIGVICLLFISLIIYSCRKDMRLDNTQSTLNADDISEFQGIYSKGVVHGDGKTTAAVDGTNFPNLIRGLNVQWDKYVVNNRSDNSRVVEFDLKSDSTLYGTRRTKAGDSVRFSNRTSAVFIKLNDGTRLNFFMKVIEDFTQTKHSVMSSLHYRQIPTTFSGLVIFYTLDRKFINGNRYKNGKLIAALAAPTSSSKQQIQSLKTNLLDSPDPDDCGGETVIWNLDDCDYLYTDSDNEDVYYCEGVPYDVIPDKPCGGGPPPDGVTPDPTPGPTGDPVHGGGGNNGGNDGNDGVDISVPDVDPSESDYLFTCPDNFSFSSTTTNNLWQEGELTNIYCNLAVINAYTLQTTNAKSVQIQQVYFGLPYYNVEGQLVYTRLQAQQIAADALNQGEVDMRKKYNANPNLSSDELAAYWIARMNYYMGSVTGNRGRVGRTGSINPANPTPSKPYKPCT